MWTPLHRCPSFASPRKRQKVEEPVQQNFLTVPKTEKLKCEIVNVNGLEVGHSSMQGYRVNMEDEHIIDTMDSLADHTLVAIMDGNNLTVVFFENFSASTQHNLLFGKYSFYVRPCR